MHTFVEVHGSNDPVVWLKTAFKLHIAFVSASFVLESYSLFKSYKYSLYWAQFRHVSRAWETLITKHLAGQPVFFCAVEHMWHEAKYSWQERYDAQLIVPFVKVMWQHRHSFSVSLVPSSSPGCGSVEGATSHMFYFPPLSSLWPKVSGSSCSSEGEQREGWAICCHYSSLSHWLVLSRPACMSCHLIHALLCLLCIFVKHYIVAAVTLLPLEEGLQDVSQNTGQAGQQVEHLHSHMYANMSNDVACLGDL